MAPEFTTHKYLHIYISKLTLLSLYNYNYIHIHTYTYIYILLQFHKILRLYTLKMGQVLNYLAYERRNINQVSFFHNKSLSKVQEHYQTYKQISQTFSIDGTEFVQIFGEMHPVFDLLDTNHNLLIDQLQLFSAMALFSKLIQLEDKIEFIFKLFDFNQLRSLSLTDLQFLMITCCSVTQKLLGVRTPISQTTIINFVGQEFQSHSRVNISQIKSWVLKSGIVRKFIDIINEQETNNHGSGKKKQQKSTKTVLSQKIYCKFQTCSRNQLGWLLSKSTRMHAYTKLLQKQYKTHLLKNSRIIDHQPQSSQPQSSQPQSSQPQSSQPQPHILQTRIPTTHIKHHDQSDITLVPNWVYGIRYHDVKYFIEFIHENQLVYFVGRVVVLFNIRSEMQRHYLEHEMPVGCLAVGRGREGGGNGVVVATCEIVDVDSICQKLPSIRIWNPSTLQTLTILKGQHKTGIHLLKYSNSGKYLISCGLITQSPIIVYNVTQNYTIAYSISCLHPTVQISNIYGIVDCQSDDFTVVTMYGVYCFQVGMGKNGKEITSVQLGNRMGDGADGELFMSYQYGCFSAITCCCYIYINQNFKYLSNYDEMRQKLVITGHEKGQVLIWSANKKSVLFQFIVQPCEITNILPLPTGTQIMICSNSSIISCWDIDFKRKKRMLQIDLTTMEADLNGYQVCSIIERPTSNHSSLSLINSQPQYLVTTSKGDFILFSFRRKQEQSLKFKIIGPRYESKKLQKIISMGDICSHKLLQRQNQQNIILFGDPQGILYLLNPVTHKIDENWKIGEPIIAFDCIEVKENIQIAVATVNNRIYCSSNLIEKNQKFEFQKPIKCLKLIMDSNHLILVAGLEGGHLHFIIMEYYSDSKKNGTRASSQTPLISRKILTKNDLNPDHNKNRPLSPLPNGFSTQQGLSMKEGSNLIKKVKIGNTPNQISLLEKKMLLITTDDNIFYILSLKDYHFNVVEPFKSPLNSHLVKQKWLNLYFCLSKVGRSKTSKKVYKLPFSIARNEKVLISAKLNGSINVWKNASDSLQQNKLTFSWHASKCTSFAIDQQSSKLYSSGESDGMLVQSIILKFYQAKRTLKQPYRALCSSLSMQNLSSGASKQHSTDIDTQIYKQIQFSTFNNEITTQKYDQHIQIRGLQNETLCRLFKGMFQQWKLTNKKLKPWNSAAKISLKLNYVYGIQTDKKRSTTLVINQPFVQFVYFISSVVIVYDPTLNSQKIYRGHRFKVTCISKINVSLGYFHCCERQGNQQSIVQLIVSGQSCFKSTIKIWNPHTLQTLKTLSSSHNWGIIHLDCSKNTILSYGIASKSQKQKTYSLQLNHAKTADTIGYRQIKQIIYSILINPLRTTQFVTTGRYNVTVWKAQLGNIQRLALIQVGAVVMCSVFRLVQESDANYQGGGNFMEEIIVGTDTGELGIISDYSKYIPIQQRAHQKPINCITLVNTVPINQKSLKSNTVSIQCQNKYIKHIVTCSQDQTIKIWTKNFELEFEQQVRKIQFQDRFLGTNQNNTSSQPMSGFTNFVQNKKGGINPANFGNRSTLIYSKQKSLFKNVSVQSVCVIYDKKRNQGELSLLLSTRNGELIVMRQNFNSDKNYDSNSNNKKIKTQKRPSFINIVDMVDDQLKQGKKKRPSSRKNSGTRGSSLLRIVSKSKLVQRISLNQKINPKPNGIGTQKYLSQMSKKNLNAQIEAESDRSQCNNSRTTKKIQNVQFLLYLRGYSSQLCSSTRAQYTNIKQKGDRVLISHHPRLEVIATMAEDQNLMFWDTQRNLIILNRMLGYLAEPTAMKFTKDGDILIIGYSDGRLLFLDSQISKSHQGKGDQKFVLPSLRIMMQDKNSCPVLSIQQSQSGDYLAVSYNNKQIKNGHQNAWKNNSANQSSHICIFANRSRQKIRTHGNSKIQHNLIFENATTIPCQADSIFKTQNNNKYGMAVFSMMFTENQGKTYLLIYEQLVNISSHNRLNFNKDGHYIIWDVNTSTMIANTDEVSNLIWKKLAVSNSVYARYQRYDSLTLNQQYNQEPQPYPNSNLLIPFMSVMANLPNHLVLGSVNGDVYLVQSSCLQYDKMFESNPKNNQLFVAKTYTAHCSQLNLMQLNPEKSYVYTTGLTDRCIYKWRIQGDLNLQNTSTTQQNMDISGQYISKGSPAIQKMGSQNQPQNQPQNQDPEQQKPDQLQQQTDIFKQVPNSQLLKQMKQIYSYKQKYAWNYFYVQQKMKEFQQNQYQVRDNQMLPKIKNITDFISTVNLVSIIGRKAHDVRDNLFYDCYARVVYSSGHSIVVLNMQEQEKKIQQNQVAIKDESDHKDKEKQGYKILDKQFMYIRNGSGEQPTQQIHSLYVSKDRRYVFTGQNGLSASISIWDISTKLRLKTIILKKIMVVLKIRISEDNKAALVYGINFNKVSFLMLLCLQSEQVLGIVNFAHERTWTIKDLQFYPNSSSRFVTCGISQTLSWKLQSNQLTYQALPYPTGSSEQCTGIGQTMNAGYYASNNKQSISICIAFLAKSSRIITGCEDGNLIFWGQNAFQRRQHTDMVMVLKSCKPNILFSGSRDGTIILWMQQSNGSGLAMHSKFNLRNQSATLFKPHGNNLSLKNTIYEGRQNGDLQGDAKQIPKSKKKKIQMKSSKQNQSNLKYQNSKNVIQQAVFQQLSIQSIEVLSLSDHLNIDQNCKNVDQNKTTGQQESFPQSQAQVGENKEEYLDNKNYFQQNFIPRRWKVLIGTVSGNIYESSVSQQNKNKIVFDNCNLLQIFHDHETPKSFFFSRDDKQIYQITSWGYFSRRRISDSALIFQQNFNKETIDMIYSPQNGIFFIIFKTQVRSFQIIENPNQQDAQSMLKSIASLQVKFITHAQISSHEKVLALGITKNSDKTVNIQIYDINTRQQIKYLISFAMPPGQLIQFIDFSLNNKIVMARLQSGKIIAQQLISLQNIKQDQIAFIQWSGQAQNLYDRNKKITQKVQSILCNNSIKNQQNIIDSLSIVRITQIVDNIFILIDCQGNIYAFNNDIQMIGHSMIKISQPSIIKFSHSKKMLGIGSKFDRNVAIFDISLTHSLKGYN